jgi:aminoglycoside phosphotransferase (APT) family kinase protein
MIRIPGETIPRKILRDAAFDSVRPLLVGQLARTAALIHAMDVARVPASLAPSGPRRSADELGRRCRSFDIPRPVLELALCWLDDHMPAEPERACLVHGDYRHGNVIVGPGDGLRAVLDWEVAHLGDPIEDLAWLCLPPWRFGLLDLPAGGLGTRQALLQAYEDATGQPVDPQRFRFWEVLGSLRWAVGCAGMLDWFRSGRDRTVERAMIARRVSESEMDLMRLMSGSA